ncbi:MAG: hypothetical protein ABIE43_05235 [Patescibacteria group bacterium]
MIDTSDKKIGKEEAKRLLIETGETEISLQKIDYEAEEKYDNLQKRRNNAILTIKERKEIIKMRRHWSYWLLGVIIAVVIFDFFVILAVGFKWMSFQSNVIVPVFVGESLIKTLGLAFIVVNFLFNEKTFNSEK